MNVLLLEPYYGGSHRAVLDGWRSRSRHRFTLLELPAHQWKWRMRHAPLTFAADLRGRIDAGERWDAVWASDMLDVAAWRGLAPEPARKLPLGLYFHENQLTYPARFSGERDVHFGFTNFTSASAADAVWFNSSWHRGEFLAAAGALLRRMPDFAPTDALDAVRRRCEVLHPGIEPPRNLRERPAGAPGPLRLLWAARWEYDKGPETFFRGLRLLREKGVDFRLSVIGARFRDAPPVFEEARREFADAIDHWGRRPTRADYEQALREADVFVSSAEHEFFGIAAAEAIAAGCRPVLPDRLAYPEVLSEIGADAGAFLYDGAPAGLAEHLAGLAARHVEGCLWPEGRTLARAAADRFGWQRLAPLWDDALERLAAGRRA